MGFLQVNIPLKKHHDVMKKYWDQLWANYTDEYAEVFIQCWNTETKQMEALLPIAEKVRKEGLVHYFRIALNEKNRTYLQQDSFDHKQLKWFMIRFIRADGTEGIEVRDYGVETTINQISTEQAEKLLQLFSKDNIEAKFTKDEDDK
ncbi:MAG: hypothetical protein KBT36_03285 [Kurthia sp.]|nr:hypothetical protein [Candidatus Kurthia equi]